MEASWEQTMLESQRSYVAQQLDAGVPVETVADDLARMGVDQARAREFVATFGPRVATAAAPGYGLTPAPAVAGATAAAPAGGYSPAAGVASQPASPAVAFGVAIATGVVAGLVIGAVILAVDLRVFFLSAPVGLAVGYAVRKLAAGVDDGPRIGAAVIGTVLGIVIARYFVFVEAIHDELRSLAKAEPLVYHAIPAGKILENTGIMSEYIHHPADAFGWRGLLTAVIGIVLAVRLVRAD